MRQGPNKRSRGRNNNNNNNRKGLPPRMHVFDSNGPDVRIRGTAHQVYEKYLGLARDASGSGDRVASENFLQHAEHYYRIILAQNEAERQARGNFDQPQPGMLNNGQGQPASGNEGGFNQDADNPFDQSIGFAGNPNPFFAQQPPRHPSNGSSGGSSGGSYNGPGSERGPSNHSDRPYTTGSHGPAQAQAQTPNTNERPESYGSHQGQSFNSDRPRRERYQTPDRRSDRNTPESGVATGASDDSSSLAGSERNISRGEDRGDGRRESVENRRGRRPRQANNTENRARSGAGSDDSE
ncbi:MAG: DUF4167 domain-containing protein [Alphaproteobacteria bacterium]